MRYSLADHAQKNYVVKVFAPLCYKKMRPTKCIRLNEFNDYFEKKSLNKLKVDFVYFEKKFFSADKIDSWVKLDRDNVSG